MSEPQQETICPVTPEPTKKKGGRPPKSARKERQTRNRAGKNQYSNLEFTFDELKASGIPPKQLIELKNKGRLFLVPEDEAEYNSAFTDMRESTSLQSHLKQGTEYAQSQEYYANPLTCAESLEPPCKRPRGRPRKFVNRDLPRVKLAEKDEMVLRDFPYRTLWQKEGYTFEDLDEELKKCTSLDIWQEHIAWKRNEEKQLKMAAKRKRLRKELEEEVEDMIEDRENYKTLVENDVLVIEETHTRLDYLSTLKGNYETITEEFTILQQVGSRSPSEGSINYGYNGRFKDMGFVDEEAEEGEGESEDDISMDEENTRPLQVKKTKNTKSRPKKKGKVQLKINFNTKPKLALNPEALKAETEISDKSQHEIQDGQEDSGRDIPLKRLLGEGNELIQSYKVRKDSFALEVYYVTIGIFISSRLAHIKEVAVRDVVKTVCEHAINALTGNFNIKAIPIGEEDYYNGRESLEKIMPAIDKLYSSVEERKVKPDTIQLCERVLQSVSQLDQRYFYKVKGLIEYCKDRCTEIQESDPAYKEPELNNSTEAMVESLKKELGVSWSQLQDGKVGSINRDFKPNKHYKYFSVVIRGAKMNTLHLLDHVYSYQRFVDFMYGVMETGYDGTPHYHILLSLSRAETWKTISERIKEAMDQIKHFLVGKEESSWNEHNRTGGGYFIRELGFMESTIIPIKEDFEVIVYPVLNHVKQFRYLTKSIPGGLETAITNKLNSMLETQGDLHINQIMSRYGRDPIYASFFKTEELLEEVLLNIKKDTLRGKIKEEGRLRYDTVTNAMIDEILESLPESTKALALQEDTLYKYYNEALTCLNNLKVKGSSKNALYLRFLIYTSCRGQDAIWFKNQKDANSDLVNFILKNQQIYPYLEKFAPVPARQRPDLGKLLQIMNERINNSVVQAKESRNSDMLRELQEERQRGYDIATWLYYLIKGVEGNAEIYKNRHLYVYGSGNNGKTSLIEFLKKHFYCFSLKFTKDFALAASDISKPYEVVIVEEFDIAAPLTKGANMSLQTLNELLGKEADAARFERAKKSFNDWITIGTKGSFYSMFPYPTYVFLGNNPLPTPSKDGAINFNSARLANLYDADAVPYIAFYERFYGILNINKRESHIPREFLDLAENKPREIKRVGLGNTNLLEQHSLMEEIAGGTLERSTISTFSSIFDPKILRDKVNKENEKPPENTKLPSDIKVSFDEHGNIIGYEWGDYICGGTVEDRKWILCKRFGC
jgi:hypothetical protein